MDHEPNGDAEPNEMAYDPDQNLEEKRGIRRKYRQTVREVEDLDNNANGGAAEVLIKAVKYADGLFQKVKGTNEATLDSTLLLQAAQKGTIIARNLKSSGGAFDVDDFISKLVTFMGGRHDQALQEDEYDDEDIGEATPLDWEKIGWRAAMKSRRVPTMDFMLGPLAIEQKKRNIGKRARLEKNKDDERKPQEITEADITRSENETTKNVVGIEKILEDCSPINLFRFIINPNDFGQSVENMFYLSFLIRDGKCALEVNENGEPEIMLCEPPTAQDYEEGLRKQQMVMELDMETWQRAIQVFNITHSVIPQRPKAEARIGNKWYG